MQLNPRPLALTRERCLLEAGGGEWLSYLERSQALRLRDLSALAGELRALGRAEAVLPPAGSFAKSVPLDRPAEWYRGDEAGALAEAICSFQAPSGGWSKNIDFTRHPRAPGEHFSLNPFSLDTCFEREGALASKSWHFVGTFDNDATTAQIRFLDRVLAARGAAAPARFREAADRGLEFLLQAQYPNGGWPQVWPLEGGYHDSLTFNDEAVANNLSLLIDLAAEGAGFTWVSPARRDAARSALEQGLRCVLRTQVQAAGTRAGWCQQYDPITLVPGAGRKYEMAALASSETAGVVDVLMRLERPSREIAAAIESAVAWLRAVALPAPPPAAPPVADGKPVWARFYELEGFQPLFGDRDGRIHRDLAAVSGERRRGYLWFSRAPRATLKAHAKWRARQKLA